MLKKIVMMSVLIGGLSVPSIKALSQTQRDLALYALVNSVVIGGIYSTESKQPVVQSQILKTLIGFALLNALVLFKGESISEKTGISVGFLYCLNPLYLVGMSWWNGLSGYKLPPALKKIPTTLNHPPK